MGVYTHRYQMKQEFFDEFLELLRKKIDLESHRPLDDEIETIWNRIDEIIEIGSISDIYYKSIIDSNLQVLVTGNKESPYKYDEKDIGQLPFYGDPKYEFTLSKSSEGILQTENIVSFVELLQNLEVGTQKKFATYYGQLSLGLKRELYIEPGENETDDEYLYQDLGPFVKFFRSCLEKNSWVYLNCS